MLLRYAFSNFQSFKDLTEVSFMLSKKIPPITWSTELPKGDRASTVLAVVGANASGKTALLKPLAFLAWFINESFDAPPDGKIPCPPHFASETNPSTFELEVEFASKRWKYRLELTRERVLHESLFEKRERYNYVFVRNWDENSDRYIVKQKGFGLAKAEAEKTRSNASLISTAAQYGVPFAQALRNVHVNTNINVYGRLHLNQQRVASAANFYARSEQHKSKMSELLARWDLGLSGVELREVAQPNPDGTTRKNWQAFGLHKVSGKEHALDFKNESSGTQGAFVLLASLLPALETGGLAVIDEFENDLHPHMIEPVLDLFASSVTNPKNAQLLFTCHALEVLNVLHKSQVMLVEKNEACESSAWRLDTMLGVRSDDNLYAKYMAGAYGAVPNL